jgi:hypothetical protein
VSQVIPDDPTAKPALSYQYDASGNRIAKTVTAFDSVRKAFDTTSTYYVRDAQGNVMATYKQSKAGLFLTERHIYGSDRLGLDTEEVKLDSVPVISNQTYQRMVGKKSYELKDHLGNVRVVISDEKTLGGTAKLLSYANYYPFGMEMPGGSWSSSKYRYGFNGQEKSLEIGNGHYTAEFWEYDGRTGRRWNQDPKPTPYTSNYATFGNNPILFNDEYGDTLRFSKLTKSNLYASIKLQRDIETKTGLTLFTDQNGNTQYQKQRNGDPLVSYKDGKLVGSKIARKTLMKIINNQDVLDVDDVANSPAYAGPGNITGSHVISGSNTIYLDPVGEDQDSKNTSSDLNNSTFVYGITFFHEFRHTPMGGGTNDPDGLLLTLGSKGRQVRLENRIRRQLGVSQYGLRTSYRGYEAKDGNTYQPFSFGTKLRLMLFKTVPIKRHVKY